VLRLQVVYNDNNVANAIYSSFSISSESTKYVLTATGYSGVGGDALATGQQTTWISNGMPFSTPDRDNDNQPSGNCATESGWWYKYCSWSALNVDGYGHWANGDPTVLTSRMAIQRL